MTAYRLFVNALAASIVAGWLLGLAFVERRRRAERGQVVINVRRDFVGRA